MNHVASSLGISLLPFSLNARDAVMRVSNSPRLSKRQRGDLTKSSLIDFSEHHRDSLLCVKYGKGAKSNDFDDDDDNNTAETLSSSSSSLSSCDDDDTENDSFSSACSSSLCTVSFAVQVVTEVHYRPKTLPEEKETLYYTDVEYRQFKRDYYYRSTSSSCHSSSSSGSSSSLSQSRRESVVKFSPQLVSSVWTYSDTATLDNKEAMFYSESDLQRFLDEFVASLNQASSSSSSSVASSADTCNNKR
jgi:hypothetical protein